MAWDFRPTMLEDGAAEFVEFALESNVEARSFEAKVKPANSTEKRGGAKARHNGRALARAVLWRGAV